MKWTRLTALVLSFAVVGAAAFGANDYYTHGGFPATGSSLSSSSMRAELDLLMAGFDKFPTLSGAANKAVVINSGATGLTTTTGTMALTGNFSIAGNFSTTGAFNTSFTQGANTTLILPVVNGTLATLAGTETLTTKTVNLASNTLTGTTAQFNVALSDNDFATLAGAESLSNKTIPAPTFSGTASGSLTSLALTTPVLTGTVTGTYTLGGTPTIAAPTFSGTASGSLTNLALTTPVLTGTVTGTYTLGGTPTLNIGDNKFTVVGSSDATKKAAFEVDGLTTATTRTITIPDRDLTVGGVHGTATSIVGQTALTFTGIPVGAKRVTILYSSLSTNGTSRMRVHLGTSSGLEASFYFGSVNNASGGGNDNFIGDAGFDINTASIAAGGYVGQLTLTLYDPLTQAWIANGNLGRIDAPAMFTTSGVKALAGPLDRIRVTTNNGTDTYDSGNVNIFYE